ncbi:MAG: hypothetical protein IJS22_07790 [Lachnospiraceae bacterium]|nr:hypothetical protein [Lachnospiraceae bacterium]
MKERKKKLIVISAVSFLFVVLAGITCFSMLDSYIDGQKAGLEAELTQIEQDRSAEELRAARLAQMKSEIAEGMSLGKKVFRYDSAEEELAYLSSVMEQAITYDIAFDEPSGPDGAYIRRGVSIDFKAENYTEARKIMGLIIGSPCRTVFRSIAVNAVDPEPQADLTDRSISGKCCVSVTLSLFFIEYADSYTGAVGTAGKGKEVRI